MDTIKETAGKVKDLVVEYRWEIAFTVVGLGIGCVCGKMIGKTMESAYHQGFQDGCDAFTLGLAASNKDDPEVLGAVLKFTTEYRK